MNHNWFYFLLVLLLESEGWSDNRRREFKKEFLFGVASSAYQIEGGWNEDGKGESNWDRYLHDKPGFTVDGKNGDVASDSYHQYRRDVEMLRELGVDFYRFSISWSRVLPTGLPDQINEAGLQYYENLIDELLKYNIIPMVTLYHFDLPQNLEAQGGWTNPNSTNWFKEYSKIIFDRFAGKVKYWVTINQPSICMESYGSKIMVPAMNLKGTADYMCVKNIMVSHAKAFRLYENEYKKKYQGSVGISISANWIDPVNNKTENVDAAEELRQFYYGLFVNPIWSKEGDFPRSVKDIVARNSKNEGLPLSRLPKLSAGEVRMLKGSADFLGLNHYTTFLTRRPTEHESPNYNMGDAFVHLEHGQQWKSSQSLWLKSAPYGIYKLCLYINKQYDYPPVMITENGWSTGPGLVDDGRVDYLKGYLFALLLAIEDGTDVKGYTVWSLLDNFEWIAGYSEKFGLYEVDFESPDKKRTARKSALFYKNVIKNRVVNDKWDTEKLEIKVSKRRMRNMKTEL